LKAYASVKKLYSINDANKLREWTQSFSSDAKKLAFNNLNLNNQAMTSEKDFNFKGGRDFTRFQDISKLLKSPANKKRLDIDSNDSAVKSGKSADSEVFRQSAGHISKIRIFNKSITDDPY